MKSLFRESKVYHLLLNIVVVAIGIPIIMSYAVPDGDSGMMSAVSMIPVIFMAGYYFTGAKGRIVISLFLAFLLVLPLVILDLEAVMAFADGFLNWLYSDQEWNERYVIFYQIIIVMAAAFLLCILTMILNYSVLLRRLLCVCLLGYLIVALIKKWEVSQWSVSFILLYLMICYVEWIQGKGDWNKEAERKRSIVWVIPFLALYLCILLLLPADKEAYEWTYVKKIFLQVKTTAATLARRWESYRNPQEDFSLYFSGFSDSAVLGGDIASQEKEVMTIEAYYSLRTNIYLTGNIYDTFDGGGWNRVTIDPETEQQADFIETMYAINRFYDGNLSDYARSASIDIVYKDLNTYHMFIPAKAYKITWENGNDTLLTEHKSYGTEYQISYMQMNIDNPRFYEMLKQESSYRYGDETAAASGILDQLNRYYLSDGDIKITEDILSERADWIGEVYLDSEEPAEEIRRYLDTMIQGCESDIDKLKAIEQELQQYTYSTTPGELPRDQDFLSYFLLDSQTGYCTYFATAFVLLARYEGIPTRYVQGYCIPVDKNNINEIRVLSSMAHAWPEAYIEGVGWIPFEPTPSYGEIRYTPWKTSDQIAGKQSDQLHYEVESNPFMDSAAVIPEETPVIDAKTEVIVNYRLIIGILLALLAVLNMVLAVDYGYRKLRYRKLNKIDKLRTLLEENMKLLDGMGFMLAPGETLTEFRLRLAESGELQPAELSFLTAFEEVRYGGREVDDQIIRQAAGKQKLLWDILKKNYRWKYVRKLLQGIPIKEYEKQEGS